MGGKKNVADRGEQRCHRKPFRDTEVVERRERDQVLRLAQSHTCGPIEDGLPTLPPLPQVHAECLRISVSQNASLLSLWEDIMLACS